MGQVKRNIVANYIGTALSAIMAIAFVPIYINFIGIEAYGLVGILGTLGTIVSILDVGLSPTLTRELARLSANPNKAQEMRDLARTLEIIYWIIAAAIGMLIIGLAPLIANYWIKAEHHSTTEIRQAIILMSVIMTAQWPTSLYEGGLRGMQHQVLLNGINVGAAAIRGIGTILILWLVSPTIQAFFAWQAFTSLLRTVASGLFLWRSLPKTTQPTQFQLPLLKQIWSFAAGMSGISMLRLILTQIDKIILSKVLTLESFGYYTIANTLATNLSIVGYPINHAVLPRLSQLATPKKLPELKNLYHLSCQFVSVLILPAAIILALFAYEILYLWTGDITTASKAALVLSLLSISTAIGSLVSMPHSLQVAYGWTRLPFYANLIALIIIIPLILGTISLWNMPGAAAAWIIINSGYALIEVPLTHHYLLNGDQKKWYVEDIGKPLMGALVVATIGRLLLNGDLSRLATLGGLFIIATLSLTAAIASTPQVRPIVLKQLTRWKMSFNL